jgi:hypothetical protein
LWGGALGVAGRRTGGCGIRCRRNCGGKRVRETRDEEGEENDVEEEAAWAAEEREREREREKRETEAAGAIASSGDLFDS